MPVAQFGQSPDKTVRRRRFDAGLALMSDLWYSGESRLKTDNSYEVGDVVDLSDGTSGKITEVHYSKIGVQYRIDDERWIYENKGATWGSPIETYVL